MTQNELITLISNDTGFQYKTVLTILRKLAVYMAIGVENDEECLLGIGKFAMQLRKGRMAYNFQTKEKYTLPSYYAVKYTPSRYIKKALNKKSIEIRAKELESQETIQDALEIGVKPTKTKKRKSRKKKS
jgi:nucleoid DNA-binding protein